MHISKCASLDIFICYIKFEFLCFIYCKYYGIFENHFKHTFFALKNHITLNIQSKSLISSDIYIFKESCIKISFLVC